jgi:YegS/Rv2252/BmrU family lipid kinase
LTEAVKKLYNNADFDDWGRNMLYFIVNKISGKGKGEEIGKKIKKYLADIKVDFQMAYTAAKEHATQLAREFSKKEDCSGIVAVGGDGTFSEVLNGIDTNVPLGFVSSGSGNDFMRSFSDKKTVEEQLEPIINSKTKCIDFIEVNGKRSLNVAGTGFDVDILIREKKLRKVFGGSVGYYVSLIMTLFTLKFRKFTMRIDDEMEINEECLIMSMANGKYFGGGMPISLESEIDDGVMELVLVKKMPLYRIPGLLIRFMKGRLKEDARYVDVYHSTKVECTVTPEVEINLDGELFKMPTFTAKLIKGGLTVFC